MGGRIAILLVLILSSVGCAKEIPLSEIWALRMPGTKNVQYLEPKHYGKSQHGLSEEQQLEHLTKSLCYQIPRVIDEQSAKAPIGPGFVVTGVGKEALVNVKKALDTAPNNTLVVGNNVTLFFYSSEFGSYVHLTKVTIDGNTVNVCYSFVPHADKVLSNHFALIPLGKLAKGTYQVVMVPYGMSEEFIAGLRTSTEKPATKEIVCDSFSFSIE